MKVVLMIVTGDENPGDGYGMAKRNGLVKGATAAGKNEVDRERSKRRGERARSWEIELSYQGSIWSCQ